SLIVPFWLVWAYAGFRRTLEIWPALLVAGASFAVPQFLVSNFHGPWLVDIVASVSSMVCLTAFLRFWRGGSQERAAAPADAPAPASGASPWLPWVVLTIVVFLWGLPTVK